MKYIKLYENRLQVKLIDSITFGDKNFKNDLINVLTMPTLTDGNTLDFIEDGFTPITAAVEYCRIDFLKELLNHGSNIDYPDDNGNTPLMIAAYNNNCFDILILLIDAGADWFIKDDSGKYFVDLLENGWLEDIKFRYPEKYQEYLVNKASDKYNL